jgi:hypothetical protein
MALLLRLGVPRWVQLRCATCGHEMLGDEAWHENTASFAFKALGTGVSGTITVEDGEVRLVGQVPRAVVIFKGLIERRIRAELGILLS